MKKLLSFKEWLIERNYIGERPDMDIVDTKKEEINIGDIVELGPETKLKGVKVGRIGRVVEKRSDTVGVVDLTRVGSKKLIIPISNFYDKEELKGRILLPSEERELLRLGGKRLWVVLTPRQYKKFKSTYRVKPLPDVVTPAPSSEPSDALRSMFSKKEVEPEAPKLPMFRDEPEPLKQPLRRFVKKDLF